MKVSGNRTRMTMFIALAAATLTASEQSIATDSAGQMISNGTLSVALRSRIEHVEQDNALQDATAATLRARLTFQSAVFRGFSALIEGDSITAIAAEEYDSFAQNRYRGTHSVIADPEGSEVNQAWLRFAFDEKSTGTIGRQRLNHGAQRFLGSVGWRQNEQTMDALSYRYASGDLSVDYSYLWNVNRVFQGRRRSAQITDFDSDSHALLASVVQPWGTLSGFVYALDFNNAAAFSSATYGVSYAGKIGGAGVTLSYAQQSEYGDNPQEYRADYVLAEVTVPVATVNLTAGYELLGSDAGLIGFATPLATLHRYQGFADMFLSTPASGVEDIYITAARSFDALGFAVTWHDYSAARGGAAYGTEWNAAASYRFTPALNAELKAARYRSQGFAVDTDKMWLTLNMAF
jgi:hypothetical protein